MSMNFTGKWAFKGQDGNYIVLDPSTNQLKSSPQSTDKNQKKCDRTDNLGMKRQTTYLPR